MFVNLLVECSTLKGLCIFNSIQFNSIQFIDQLMALKGQQENCTYMNKQYAQLIDTGGKELYD